MSMIDNQNKSPKHGMFELLNNQDNINDIENDFENILRITHSQNIHNKNI
jgi:hypothetical protein